MRNATVERPVPPRAPIAFRVGVVGHRPNRLPADAASLDRIGDLLTALLAQVRDAVRGFALERPGLYADDAPHVLAVSPLAEGSDRIFARLALDRGYRLCVPMPFPQADYETDFAEPSGRSIAEFRELLERAAAETALIRFQLDGSRDDAAGAYGAAGRIVVNQSDLLVAIWDGEPAQGGGGTVDTIREALDYHVPVIWIDAHAPFGWKLLRHMKDAETRRPEDTDAAGMADAIRTIVIGELALPVDDSQPPVHGHDEQRAPARLAAGYFAEHRPAINWHFLWKPFRNIMSGEGPVLPRLRTRDFVAEAKAQNDGPDDDVLIAHFAWADKLADLYADAHRSGVVATSGLSAIAVFLGLAPVAFELANGRNHGLELSAILLELFVVAFLWRTISRAKRKRYHEKWLEYRILAEWIRQLRFMVPLGGGRPLLRTRAHLSVYGEPTRSWMYWHVRAITRAYGLPDTIADRVHVAQCLDGIVRTVDSQAAFHSATMERCERIQHRLHKMTKAIAFLTIAGVAIHLALMLGALLIEWPHRVQETLARIPEWIKKGGEGLLILCSAFLPAAGASLANINNQGEFARLGKRARAMRDSFLRLKSEADTMQQHVAQEQAPVTMTQTTSLASRMASTMLEEVIDWRVVVLDLPQGLE